MVLLAAAISTKGGKTIVSRQFVEMTKARIEGLLSAFPKLMSTGKQHTFVETDSVRYVYQPLDKLYMLLITTKASNILEDLETLRLFSRVIPEYCATMDETEILCNAFNLIFAFDEIVALGYRESVNLAQIRTFVEMDSHEERVFQAVRQTQEREAKNKMREKAKELQRQRMEANKRGIKSSSGVGLGGFGSGMGNNSFSRNAPSGLVMDESHGSGSGSGSGLSNDTPRAKSILKQPSAAKAMKLGSKARDVESFVDQLKSEGENVISPVAVTAAPANSVKQKFAAVTLEHVEDVYVRLEERLIIEFGNESGLRNLEVHGLVTLRISDEKLGRIRIGFENTVDRNIQIQTHPNVDKELFKAKSQVGLKNAAKPFPIDTDVSILKWRLHSTEENLIPLTINCWPSDNGQGGCDVNIEYVLEHDHWELEDVIIIIPIPSGVNPVIVECDGEYNHDSRKNSLTWRLSSIDKSNKSGALEFSVANSQTQDFFPVHVTFMSKCSYASFKVSEVRLIDDDSPVKFSSERIMYTERYDIV